MSHPTPPTAIDARRFRDTLGHYASGITIVSGTEDGAPIGFTCQSFYSVSVDPPLVSFSVMKTSTTYPRIAADGKFAVNVLAHDQRAVSNQFARKGTDKWAGIDWSPAASGNPITDALKRRAMAAMCEALAAGGGGGLPLTELDLSHNDMQAPPRRPSGRAHRRAAPHAARRAPRLAAPRLTQPAGDAGPRRRGGGRAAAGAAARAALAQPRQRQREHQGRPLATRTRAAPFPG